jgi:mycothiol synthase
MGVTVAPAPAGEAQVAVAQALDRAWRDATGDEALNEAVWIDLAAPQPDSAAFVATTGSEGEPAGYAHVARADNAAAGTSDYWSLGFVVGPSVGDTVSVARSLLDAITAHVREHGGGAVVAWRTGEHDGDQVLGAMHFAVTRELHQMRVALPIVEGPRWPAGVFVRTFVPDVDDREWLAVNNRAFAGHAEQGNWTEATLQRRLREPWFDPTLFFLAVDDQGIAGFNWCKRHPAAGTDPPVGEIFVIGVDDRARGTKLGRPLAIHGLNAMADRGLATGMLYVAADNEAALALYRSIGFRTHRTDRAFERTIEPIP